MALTPTWAHNYGRLWTDCQESGRIFRAEKRLWTRVDKGKRTPQPQVAGSIPVPSAPYTLN
jgi:hypothetical protein